MGYFREWKINEKTNQFTTQHYKNGDNCPGFRDRETLITYTCKPTADKLEIVKLKEEIPCIYEFIIASKYWCSVEEIQKQINEEKAETIKEGNKEAGGRQLEDNHNIIPYPSVTYRPTSLRSQ